MCSGDRPRHLASAAQQPARPSPGRADCSERASALCWARARLRTMNPGSAAIRGVQKWCGPAPRRGPAVSPSDAPGRLEGRQQQVEKAAARVAAAAGVVGCIVANSRRARHVQLRHSSACCPGCPGFNILLARPSWPPPGGAGRPAHPAAHPYRWHQQDSKVTDSSMLRPCRLPQQEPEQGRRPAAALPASLRAGCPVAIRDRARLDSSCQWPSAMLDGHPCCIETCPGQEKVDCSCRVGWGTV
jgi:hypothetical protein